jgi:nicotinamide mononucleotide (NMN) deamidase PncC
VLGTISPEGGLYGKGTGETHIALATPDGVEHRTYPMGGTDELTQRWISNRALDWLRRIALT